MEPMLAIAPFVAILIGTAISALAQHFLAPGQRGTDSSPTYGIERLDNNRGEGAPVPVILGTRNRIEPQLISVVTKQTGTEQGFNLLYLLGYGELASMDSDYEDRLRINEQPPSAYKDLRVAFRYGTASQTAIAGFDRTGKGTSYSNKLGAGDSVTHEMAESADEVHLLFVWSSGVYRISTGVKKVKNASPGIKVEYRDAEDSSAVWKAAALDKTRNPDWRNYDENPKSAVDGHYYFTETSTSVVRRQIEFRFPRRGRYEVKITGLYDDTSQPVYREPTLVSVNEVTQESRTYAGYALLALEGVASENLSGGLPSVSLLTTGIKLSDPRGGAAAPSDNPAVIVYNLLLNSTWGAGYASTDLHAASGQSFRTVADACDATVSVSGAAAEKSFLCNYVIDSRDPLEDHVDKILLGFRAILYDQDGQIRILQDTSVSSSRTFDARASTTNRKNVLHDEDGKPRIRSYSLPDRDRYNAVVIQYVDAEDDVYEQKTYQYPEGTIADFKPKEIVLLGVTRRTQVKREARYQYGLLTLADEFVELGIGWGDHDLVPLDRILLYDDYRYSAGADWKVYDVRFGMNGEGKLLARKYDANVYDATSVSSAPATSYVGAVVSSGKGGASAANGSSGAAAKTSSGTGSGTTKSGASDLRFTVTAGGAAKQT